MGKVKFLISVKTKIVGVVLIFFMLAVIGLSYLHIKAYDKYYRSSLESQGVAVGRSLVLQLRKLSFMGIPIQELDGFEEQCASAVDAYDDVIYAMVIEADGHVLFSSETDKHREKINDEYLPTDIETGDKAKYVVQLPNQPHVLDVLVPFRYQAEGPITFIRVGLDSQFITVHSRSLFLKTLFTAFICLAVFLGIFLNLLNLIIMRPLSRLENALMSIDRDSLTQIDVRSNDEFGNIATTFNKMRSALHHSQKRLKKYTQELEEQVHQRTRELTRANRLLQIDIEKRKLTEEKLEELAYNDMLTGLPNRVSVLRDLNNFIESDNAFDECAAVIFIDIDRFKYVNDTFGHATGDDLLVEISVRLENALHRGDVVGRLGGDEFIVITRIDNSSVALDTAGKIIEALTPSISLVDFEFIVTASIGIALYPCHATTSSDLLQYADSAMYQAKTRGRNCVSLYSSELTAASKNKIVVESELRAALENEQFVIHYQPRIHLDTGQIASVEALIRWNHPKRGMLAPASFLPFASETNLIVDIGKWVLEESCRAAARWGRRSGAENISVSVNVSELQVRSGTLVETIENALSRASLSPRRLEIEVLEECVMINDEIATQTFQALGDLDIRLSIDDFGTGYSSLNRLTQLPFDTLKMDGVFISELSHHKDDKAIVQTILSLGHSLGMRVVAECIETLEQANYLRSFGCDEGQGYYFSKPLPERELIELINRRELVEA